jgi:hypothetical protein
LVMCEHTDLLKVYWVLITKELRRTKLTKIKSPIRLSSFDFYQKVTQYVDKSDYV